MAADNTNAARGSVHREMLRTLGDRRGRYLCDKHALSASLRRIRQMRRFQFRDQRSAGGVQSSEHVTNQRAASRSLTLLPISRDVGDHTLLKGNILDSSQHAAEVHQQAVSLGHPDQRVLRQQAR